MSGTHWHKIKDYSDLKFEKTDDGIAKITINRPEVRNAFRPQTVEEMKDAFDHCRDDASIGVVILTGEGDKAFCSGGDQKVRGDGGYVGIGRRSPPQHPRRAKANPWSAQTGRGHGGGLCHRRRARAACGLRPDHRGGQRPVRPDRPARRILRRRSRGRVISRAWSDKKKPAKSGSSAVSTTRSKPSTWVWSTPSSRSSSWRKRR